MPEEKITPHQNKFGMGQAKIWEKKWFLPVGLVAVIVVANLVLYINLMGQMGTQIQILNVRIENLEKTVTQLSRLQGLLPLAIPAAPEITPEEFLPGATPTEEGLLPPAIPNEAIGR